MGIKKVDIINEEYMDISQKISSIIDVRKTRLPLIAKQRGHISCMLNELNKLVSTQFRYRH